MSVFIGPAFPGRSRNDYASRYAAWCAAESCVVCLEPLCSKETVTLGCGHVNHKECIEQAISLGKLTCPECRRKIKTPRSMADLVRAYQRQHGMSARNFVTPLENYVHVVGDSGDESESGSDSDTEEETQRLIDILTAAGATLPEEQ